MMAPDPPVRGRDKKQQSTSNGSIKGGRWLARERGGSGGGNGRCGSGGGIMAVVVCAICSTVASTH